MVVDVDRTVGQTLERLLEDADRLPHLLHAHEEAIVDVAVRADRDVEVVRLVVEVREILAHVVGDAATRAASAPRVRSSSLPRLTSRRGRPCGRPRCAFLREHRCRTSSIIFGKVRTKFAQILDPAVGDVGAHAADARERRREARADPALEQRCRRSRAPGTIQRNGVNAPMSMQVVPSQTQVRDDARQLHRDHAQHLAPLGDLDAEQPLGAERERDVVARAS